MTELNPMLRYEVVGACPAPAVALAFKVISAWYQWPNAFTLGHPAPENLDWDTCALERLIQAGYSTDDAVKAAHRAHALLRAWVAGQAPRGGFKDGTPAPRMLNAASLAFCSILDGFDQDELRNEFKTPSGCWGAA